ncbi:MAG: hypothetical protein PHI71_11390 [Acidiphilium sp.]|nr:hypothetical protein [Acidiphilium sp.]
MARPKKFARRTLVRLTESQIKEIGEVLDEREDRSDFLREAADLEIAIRRLDVYRDLIGHLTTHETLIDFCAKAVRQAVLKRVAALSEIDEIDSRMSIGREE